MKLTKPFLSFFLKGHKRSIIVKQNILASFGIKGLNILTNMALVPITINYVNTTQYGIWITLSSIIAWFSFFDLGLGHGLRNKLAEAIAKNDSSLAKSLVSTTYALISIIIGITIVIYFLISPFLNWSNILNAESSMSEELRKLATIVFIFFCLRFVFQLIGTILSADQKTAFGEAIRLLGSILSLAIIYILSKVTTGNLTYLGLTISVSPLFILVVATLWLFNNKYTYCSPSLKSINFKYWRSLINLGGSFFIIQISLLIMYQSSNIIISQIFSPEEVTPFAIVYKYFQVITILSGIIINPFWSAFTEAYINKEKEWIIQVVKKITLLWIPTSLFAILMLIISPYIYKLWIGNVVHIPLKLSLTMCILVISLSFGGIFIMFMNGVGKIRLQLFSTAIGATIFIPLAIILSKYLNFGISGVVIATIIANFYGPIVAPIQFYKIITNKATGIWNR